MLSKSLKVIAVLSGWMAFAAAAQVPGVFSYQGKITVGGTNFTGTGQFKFALVNAVALTWNSTQGLSYQVQSSPSLAPTAWANCGAPVLATNGAATTQDPILTSVPMKFYRVKLLLP